MTEQPAETVGHGAALSFTLPLGEFGWPVSMALLAVAAVLLWILHKDGGNSG